MYKKIARFSLALFVSFTLTVGCTPVTQATPTVNPPSITATASAPTMDTPTATEPPVATNTDIPTGAWPVYTLTGKLPDAPKQVRLYTQAYPAALPAQERVDALVAQLQIPGKVSSQPQQSEGGEPVLDVSGDKVNMRLWSVDPLLFVLDTGLSSTPTTPLSPEARIKTAEAFLNARGLLTFPHITEPPTMSRNANIEVRVVPLIDGIPLYDYNPLNGRMLVSFNAEGQVSYLIWRPLKSVAGDAVNLVPAATAWEQFVKGNVPVGSNIGQCWQANVFDSHEPDAGQQPVNDASCGSSGGGESAQPYATATINDVRLVYFTPDLSLGISPFATAADSPARLIFPMWQFSGTTDQGRDLQVLWPATPSR